MNRLTQEEKTKIIKFIERGKSLNYLSKEFKRNKSALYYHYKKNFGKKLKSIKINEKDDLFIGELMGLFTGDGYLFYDKKAWKYMIRFFFSGDEKDYVKELEYLFNQKLKKKPWVYKSNNKNLIEVRYCSKELFLFIQEYVEWKVSRTKHGHNRKARTVFLKSNNYSKKFKIGFLRGFIDSDGHISNKNIIFASASKKIMGQTKDFLIDLKFTDFKYSFYNDCRENRVGMYYIRMRKSERAKFFRIVKPRNLIRLK